MLARNQVATSPIKKLPKNQHAGVDRFTPVLQDRLAACAASTHTAAACACSHTTVAENRSAIPLHAQSLVSCPACAPCPLYNSTPHSYIASRCQDARPTKCLDWQYSEECSNRLNSLASSVYACWQTSSACRWQRPTLGFDVFVAGYAMGTSACFLELTCLRR
jgi:hypothetical protein